MRARLKGPSMNKKDIEMLTKHFVEHGWQLQWEETRPAREAISVSTEDLGLDKASKRSLEKHNFQVYRHQHEAISCFLNGANLAVTTPTASGKTLIFNTCAIETLCRDPKARIVAICPLKALASEQESRWKVALREAGVEVKVGRIDGDVPVNDRLKLSKECRVLVLTPDIIHAWLFFNIAKPPSQELPRNRARLAPRAACRSAAATDSSRRQTHLLHRVFRPASIVFVCVSFLITNNPDERSNAFV